MGSDKIGPDEIMEELQISNLTLGIGKIAKYQPPDDNSLKPASREITGEYPRSFLILAMLYRRGMPINAQSKRVRGGLDLIPSTFQMDSTIAANVLISTLGRLCVGTFIPIAVK